MTVDLDTMVMEAPNGERLSFVLDEGGRELREGLDMLDLTLRSHEAILASREADRRARPWAYAS